MTITHNILRIGKFTEYKHYCEVEDGIGNVLSGKRTRDLALHFCLCFFSGIFSALIHGQVVGSRRDLEVGAFL